MIKKAIDLLLYGNFWIAGGALALTWQSQWIMTHHFAWDTLAAFVFFATLLLYALHRILGILRLKDFLEIDRYAVIAQFRHHIMVYACVAGLASLYYFFCLPWSVQLALIIPAFLSLGYVLPIFGSKRRLRDFDQIKIYLVAIVWAGVTVGLPAIAAQEALSSTLVLMFIERALFIFAITLPFDIRDLRVDDHSQVKTIPGQLGVPATRRLAQGLLCLALILAMVNTWLGCYGLVTLIALAISYLICFILVQMAHAKRHDYFYSGLLDGTMMMQFLLVWGSEFLVMNF